MIYPQQIKVYPLESFIDIKNFDCGVQIYNDWLKNEALEDQNAGLTRVWLFIHKDMVIGYCSLLVTELRDTEETRATPSIFIDKLARDKSYKGSGIGRLMLDWIITESRKVSRIVGCKLLIATLDDGNNEGLYLEHGFLHIPDTDMLILDISDCPVNS